mmetsp:Transcript_18814/g.50586  ORF Transcript_18814/g.50586 Transcript_18814/m.50586 type:complete len:246 (+) Transcript_18814:134-871(+)
MVTRGEEVSVEVRVCAAPRVEGGVLVDLHHVLSEVVALTELRHSGEALIEAVGDELRHHLGLGAVEEHLFVNSCVKVSRHGSRHFMEAAAKAGEAVAMVLRAAHVVAYVRAVGGVLAPRTRVLHAPRGGQPEPARPEVVGRVAPTVELVDLVRLEEAAQCAEGALALAEAKALTLTLVSGQAHEGRSQVVVEVQRLRGRALREAPVGWHAVGGEAKALRGHLAKAAAHVCDRALVPPQSPFHNQG